MAQSSAFKSKMFTAMTLFFTILAVVSTITLARAAYAAGTDDVFMDEGDGDFDQVPAAPVAKDIVDTPEAPLLAADQAEPAPIAPTEDPAAPAAVAPKEKKSKKKESKKKVEKTAAVPVAPNGSFVVTKDACPMMRTPASTGEPMLTLKPSKKIWVEQAGEGWVKGWNKAGEPGYISTECVEL